LIKKKYQEKKEKKNMSANFEKARLPIFYGDEDNYDK